MFPRALIADHTPPASRFFIQNERVGVPESCRDAIGDGGEGDGCGSVFPLLWERPEVRVIQVR
jgi:hypothetical protein